ncbi:MAG: hypothetical protein IT385_31125 [Deltaproteobacteria bacterium]|nr:hypothetical protein [Deltaproteobacteria bacterium]
MLRPLLAALPALVALVSAPRASAQTPPPPTPEQALVYQNLTVVRLNPLGLQNQFDLDFRQRLYDPGDSLIMSGNYVGLSLAPILTPGLVRLGVAAKVQPLAIFKLELKWEYINFFGNFDLLQSWDDPDQDFSDTAIADRGEEGLNYATDGWQATIDVELRARVGALIVRSRAKLGYVEMALRGADTVFYDQYFDLLLPGSGWFLTNDADLLVQVNEHLILGVRHSFADVFYGASDFAPDGERDTDSAPTHRIGPLAAWTFFDEPGATFNRPTIILILNWYLQHRFRTGEDVSQAFPYIVLGFAFGGDLYRVPEL